MNARFKAIRSAQGKAKPELPASGFERRIEWTPAYDLRHPDPKKNYGVHGMNMRAVLRGPAGAVVFILYTNWQLPVVLEELKQQPCGSICLNGPLPADVGYHSPKPFDWQEEGCPMEDDCKFLGGGPCWYDGSSSQAQDVFDLFVTRGEEALWSELERRYRATFSAKGDSNDS